MGRKKIPVELQKLKGQDKEHPSRIPTFVPKTELPLGACPAHLGATAKAVWEKMVKNAPAGILTGNDSELLGTTCELVALVRDVGVKELPAAKIALAIACLARFGCSPSDRRSLGTNEPPAGSNVFDEF